MGLLASITSEYPYAKDELEYELTMVKLIGEIHDSHGQLFGPADKLQNYFGANFAPIKLKYLDEQFVVSELVEGFNQSVSLGDVITHLDGKPIKEIILERTGLFPASNEAARMRDICRSLVRSNKDELMVTLSDGTIKKVVLFDQTNYRKRWIINSEKSFKMLPGNIGYITLANITGDDVISIKEEFKKAKGIIIDIRNYPSTFVPYSLGSFFVEKTTPFVKAYKVCID